MADVPKTVTREEAIKFLECACRNWSKVPRLSEDDIADVATELLRFLSERERRTAQEVTWQPIETIPNGEFDFFGLAAGSIERFNSEDVVVTCKAPDRPLICFACGDHGFIDDTGEQYDRDGLVCDAGDATAEEDDVLRLAFWLPITALAAPSLSTSAGDDSRG